MEASNDTEDTSFASYAPGDVVLTSYGVGVITRCPVNIDCADKQQSNGTPSSATNDNTGREFSSSSSSHFQVRLWRVPGKSISSASTAHLLSEAIIEKLPAAPGMTTTRVLCDTSSIAEGDEGGYQTVLVHSYDSQRQVYLVTPQEEAQQETTDEANRGEESDERIAPPPQWIEASISELRPSSSAKFYPLLVQLMHRASQTTHAATQFVQDKRVHTVVKTGAAMIQEKQDEVMKLIEEKEASIVEGTDKQAAAIQSLVSSTKDQLPAARGEVNQLYQMLKDEEITVLLEKGKERLEQLMSASSTDIVTPQTRSVLKEFGIVVSSDSQDIDSLKSTAKSTIHEAMTKSRDAAKKALDEFLSHQDLKDNDVNVEEWKEELESNFTTMLETLSQAAKSDRYLNNILSGLEDKTQAWQEATGRLWNTKSGSLFLEGANRLQARAKNILGQDGAMAPGSSLQANWNHALFQKWTKAFSEGDAAVARLKSLELGDAMRNRLVHAIEARSGSLGGLDGIIAGALSKLPTSASSNGDAQSLALSDMLQQLQQNATGATRNARETLLTVLSRRNEYQEAALLRIEQVLCNLDEHILDEEMTPQEIAAIASGQGGTAALFDPIAKRATKEIQKHLQQATVTFADNPAMQKALQHVGKILSGELSLNNVMDEMVAIFNDDKVVAAGESLVKTGEVALDAIENMSGNKMADDVLQIAEKAGITKESVMSQLESLNVNEILDTAGNAVTDQTARRELVSSATDTALDFVLRILPSMPVPPFDGVRDGLLYHLSNLSMEGFKVKKEDIVVEIAGMKATKQNKRKDANKKKNEPVFLNLEEMKRKELGVKKPISDDGSNDDIPDMTPKEVKATELLIIDVQRISAVLEDAVWKFEQTYMPYLKGSGKANVKLSDGSIRLQFELRKRRKEPKDEVDDDDEEVEQEWEPVLCLHDRSCSIEEVDLQLQGEGRLTWIINKLAVIFKGPLRDYVVRTIVGVLTSKSGYILEQLNNNLAPYWGLILRTTGLKLEELVEADNRVITAQQPDEDDGLIELVWRENLPLGMNLLLNDDSGRLKVVDFPRGSQARSVCTDKGYDPEIFNGATIVAVNGTRYDMQEDLFDALKNPGRPKSILFELANPEDAARIKAFVEGSPGGKKYSRTKSNKSKSSLQEKEKKREFKTREVAFRAAGELGLEFGASIDDFGLFVKSFVPGEGDTVLAAERSGKIKVGDIMTHVNGKLVIGECGKGRERAFEILRAEGSARPLILTFTENYLIHKVFERGDDGVASLGGPEEMKLSEENKRIVLHDFENVSGTAETNGILIGDHLVFINGSPVGAGCKIVNNDKRPSLNEIYQTLRDKQYYPMALTFARPKLQEGSRWTMAMGGQREFSVETSETICVTAESYDQIGCVFEAKENNNDIILTDLFAVPGQLQLAMKPFLDTNGRLKLAIESVDGQFVPTYASTEIVMNAMKRSWNSDGKVEVLFCDDARKEWMRKLS